MIELLQFALLGLGAGTIYAALGTGVVLTYQAAGVINISLGAMGMYIGYTYAFLRNENLLVLPIGTFSMPVLPVWAAILLCLAIAMLLGLLAYALVFRPLRAASGLLKLVAAVGIVMVLQSLAVLRFPSTSASVPPILANDPLHIGGLTVPWDRFLLAAAVIAVAVLLWAMTRFTRTGLAMRAVAEDERAAMLLGHSPGRLSALAWLGSSALAGLLGILASPITGLDPVTNSLFVVPALAVAIVGRLRSFGVTVAAGIALGMIQSVVLKLQGDYSWLPQTGLRDVLPFLVIVVTLAVGGGRLPSRGTEEDPRLPAVPRGGTKPITVAATLLAGVALILTLDGPYRTALTTSVVAVLVCLGIVVVTGMLGQISLAQMTFAGAAGFVLSNLTTHTHLPFPLPPLIAVTLAVLLGVGVAVPALRIRGVTLGVVTLGLAVAVSEFVFKNPDWTGGFGGSRVPELRLFGVGLGGGGDVGFALFALFTVTACAVGVVWLRRTRLGGQMLTIRANERAAAAAGINIAGVKLTGFGIAAGLAGTAGVLLGYQQESLAFQNFDVFVSLTYVAVVYLAGISRVSGAVIAGLMAPGGLVYYALDRWLELGKYNAIVSAIGLLVALVTTPGGVAGELDRQMRWLAGRRRRPTVPEPSGEQAAVLGEETERVVTRTT
ncbi:ABC transporter permease [Streptomyces iranensis]|uniref:Branched-chain amino acid transport system permease protein n=1 Tax=Streptomyces iranensis TaxID=576784 RepID=A0A061A527_9ACTN|nr:ABC transporter permease [Streptomyces iranensis]MBP2063494.1 branched-chain amino acid transport system permease protein [Streptomyces iranensis]CDR17933.1 inner-membrane translocator [Streptomyces iranensis]